MNTRYFVYLAIMISTITLLLSSTSVKAIDIETPYAITLNITKYGVMPKYIYVIDSNRFMIIGSINNTNAITIMRIIDPYKGLSIEQIYPLIGEPTTITTNGFPVNRIAIGTSKGEVLLFNIESGRIARYLYTILGADFYVDKIAIMRSATGSYIIAVLVSKGGPMTYPCLTCYIYIFNEDGRGMIRIGPNPGNVTITYSGIYVYDMIPLKIYTSSEVYYDASRLLITYTKAMAMKTLTLNITLYINNTYIPGANTLVEIAIYNRSAIPQSIVRYGINADSSGIAKIPLPLLYGDKTYANITIRDRLGRVVYLYILTPEELKISDEIVLPPAILVTEPDIRNAIKVYGTPPFLRISLELLDVSNAPLSYRSIAVLPTWLDQGVRGLIFITSEGADSYVFIYTFPPSGYLYISKMTIDGGRIVFPRINTDYVCGVESIDAIAYRGNEFIHIALSDGRIRTYQRVGDSYRLIYIYNVGSSIKRLIPYIEARGYAYIAITAIGMQMVSIDPYLVPFLRGNLSIVASVEGFIDADVLPDFSTGIIVGQTRIIVLRNIYQLLQSAPTTIENIIAPSIRLRITLPNGESMDKVYVNFSYPDGYLLLKPSPDGIITIPNIIPGIEYRLYIWYEEPYIQPETIAISLGRHSGGVIDIPVVLKYREYELTLIIKDQYVDRPIAPYRIVVDGKTVIESSSEPKVSLKLIYGYHDIEINPAYGYETVYQGISMRLFIDRDQIQSVTLMRKIYRVVLTVLDSLTRGMPITPINISFDIGINSTIISNGSIVLRIPYGNYSIVITPAKGYENAYIPKNTTISVQRDTNITIVLDRKMYTVHLGFMDKYVYTLIAPIDIYLNGTLVRQGVRGNISIKIPFGVWSLRLSPSIGYEGSYEVLEDIISISGDIDKVYYLNRRIYDVVINVRDSIGRIIAPLKLYVIGIVNTSTTIEPTQSPRAYFSLPYGNYTIIVKPVEGYENIYRESIAILNVDSPKTMAITINRVSYTLRIVLRDVTVGVLRGRFEIYVNGTKVIDNVGGPINISLPCGIYTVYASPMPAFMRMYSTSKPVTVHLFNSTSIEIPIMRNMYTLRIIVLEGETPIRNAEVSIVSEETGAIVTKLITDEYGSISTKIIFGSYIIKIEHPNYETRYIMLSIDGDTQELVYLRPTIATYIYRFLPIIGILIGIGIAIYIGLKIRAIIAKRLVIEEEVF